MDKMQKFNIEKFFPEKQDLKMSDPFKFSEQIYIINSSEVKLTAQ